MTDTTKTAPASSESIWSFLTDEGKAVLAGLESFLSNVSAKVVSAVLPTAVATATAEVESIASGDTKNTGNILAAGVKNAEAAALQVGAQATVQEIAVIAGATHAAAATPAAS